MNVVGLLALQKNQLLSIKKSNNLYYFTDQDTFQESKICQLILSRYCFS